MTCTYVGNNIYKLDFYNGKIIKLTEAEIKEIVDEFDTLSDVNIEMENKIFDLEEEIEELEDKIKELEDKIKELEQLS